MQPKFFVLILVFATAMGAHAKVKTSYKIGRNEAEVTTEIRGSDVNLGREFLLSAITRNFAELSIPVVVQSATDSSFVLKPVTGNYEIHYDVVRDVAQNSIQITGRFESGSKVTRTRLVVGMAKIFRVINERLVGVGEKVRQGS